MQLDEGTQKLIVWLLSGLIGGFGMVCSALFIWGVQRISTSFLNLIVESQLLNQRLTDVAKQIEVIPKMQQDINHLHSKVRSLEGELNSTD